MKKKINVQKLIKMAYKETKRSSLAIYLILRFLVILCMILQILRGDLNNALLCLLSLVLLFAPLFIQNKYEITLPDGLEISIYLFIFSAEILGEIRLAEAHKIGSLIKGHIGVMLGNVAEKRLVCRAFRGVFQRLRLFISEYLSHNDRGKTRTYHFIIFLPPGYLLSDFFKDIRKIIFVFQQGTNSCLLAV